jgi:hypothetical protein
MVSYADFNYSLTKPLALLKLDIGTAATGHRQFLLQIYGFMGVVERGFLC